MPLYEVGYNVIILHQSGIKWVMLIGEYKHTLDQKKRVALPSKFRKELGGNVVITCGLDNCLFVYPLKEWEKVAEKLGNLSIGQADTRGFNRFMLAGAHESEIDGAGRILIPDTLKAFAFLKERVTIMGVHTRLEIWDEDRWELYKKKVSESADALAEKLGEVGAI